MSLPIVVTTSWDDGHPLDFRIAKMLKTYGLKGTFYIPLTNYERDVMNETGIKSISEDFEVGSHTMSHRPLLSIGAQDAIAEIFESKKRLELITGKEISAFCYPKGIYNKFTLNNVKRAGYKVARTTQQYRTKFPKDPFQMWTSLCIHPQTYRYCIGYMLYNRDFYPIRLINSLYKLNIVETSKSIFDTIYEHGGVFHIWSHSWEIEQYELWDDLEAIFEYISNKKDVAYLSNSDLLSLR